MPEETDKPTIKPVAKRYYDYVSVGKRTKQVAYFVEQHDKTAMFEQLIKNSDKKQIVVMVKSKRNADALSKYLKEKDISATVIHGNHRVEQIEEAGKAFNAGEINILITTDMILKSLNLTNIQQILSYDLPLKAEEYFVRLSYVDEIGESISFVTLDEEKVLETIEFMMKLEMPQEELEGFTPTPAPQGKRLGQRFKDQKKKPRHSKKRVKKESKKEEL
ncbi:MAG: helicase [Helicobacteraceae bacterium CG2_30_36_10]|nr:MAG: helicase [Helicobacteraceae bacterium CG2_30_36_10]